MARNRRVGLLLCGLAAFWTVAQLPAQEVLPKEPSKFQGKIDAAREKSVPDWPQAIQAPKGAPNVLLILLDDVGFGATSTFGGPVAAPELSPPAACPSPGRISLCTWRSTPLGRGAEHAWRRWRNIRKMGDPARPRHARAASGWHRRPDRSSGDSLPWASSAAPQVSCRGTDAVSTGCQRPT